MHGNAWRIDGYSPADGLRVTAMSNGATTCIIKTGWLASAVLAVASLIPVTGVAAEWDIAIEGGYAPAREALSVQYARLEPSASGVFVAGIFGEMVRTPALVHYAPNSNTPAWTSMLGHASDLYAPITQRVNPAVDGSSLLMGAQLTRLDASGHVEWAAYPSVPEKVRAAAVLPGGDVLVVADQALSLRRHDGATGRLIHSSSQSQCYAASIVVADVSTAYVAWSCVDPQTAASFHQVLQFDLSTNQVRWTYPTAQLPTMAADATGVYLADGSLSIIKLSATNGAVVWSFSRSPGLRMLGSVDNGDLISSYDIGTAGNAIKRIERIDYITGLSLWARDIPGTFKARANRDTVAMTGTNVVAGVNVPYVEVLDSATGATAWRTDIAVPTGTQVRVADAVSNGSHVVALGKQCPAATGDVLCELAVWHLDRLSGVVAAAQPLLVQSAVLSDTKTSPNGIIWTAAVDWVATGQRVRLFAHSPIGGTLFVETPTSAPMSTPSAALPAESVAMAIGAYGNIAVLLKRRNGNDAVIMSFDTAGAFRWRKSLLAGLPVQTGVTADLVSVDTAGNVLLGKQEFFGQPQPWTGYTLNTRWMARLAAANGAVEWQREFRPTPPGSMFFISVPQAVPVDDDLAIREAPADETWTGVARMSGVDGSVGWINGDIGSPWFGLHRPGPTSLLTVGTYAPATTGRIDPVSGATQWVTPIPYSGDQFFFPWKVLESPTDGRYLLSTTRRTGGAGIVEVNGAFMLSVDSQTGNVDWANRFEPTTSNRFERMDAVGVAGNRIYATGPSRSIANYVFGLMALDAATGTEGEVRTLTSSTWRLPGDVALGVGNAMKIVDGGVLLQWPLRPQIEKAPHLTLARRDLDNQKVFGDIRVTLDWSPITVAGAPRKQLTYTATNAGPDSAEAIRSIIDVPADLPLRDVTCTINATPCDVEIGAAWITGLHTIPAGAQLTISVRIADYAPFVQRAIFSASAVGPFNLVEPTLNDNFAESELGTTDLIMRNGFD